MSQEFNYFPEVLGVGDPKNKKVAETQENIIEDAGGRQIKEILKVYEDGTGKLSQIDTKTGEILFFEDLSATQAAEIYRQDVNKFINSEPNKLADIGTDILEKFPKKPEKEIKDEDKK